MQQTAVAQATVTVLLLRSHDYVSVPPTEAAGQAIFVFKLITGATATIKTIEIQPVAIFGSSNLVRPNLANAQLIEASGIGAGTLQVNSTGMSYVVTSPVSVPAGRVITLTVGDVFNGRLSCANNLFDVKVSLKDSAGNVVGTGTGGHFCNREIHGTGIYDNTITASDIATDAVTGDELAGVRELVFKSCTVDMPDNVGTEENLYVHLNGASTYFQRDPITGTSGFKVAGNCPLPGITSDTARVIFQAPAIIEKGLIIQGAQVHCPTATTCHVDVVVYNAFDSTAITSKPKIYSYIGFRE